MKRTLKIILGIVGGCFLFDVGYRFGQGNILGGLEAAEDAIGEPVSISELIKYFKEDNSFSLGVLSRISDCAKEYYWDYFHLKD